MADISITASAVLKGTGATTATGVAGVAVTAGQVVYLDSATSTIKLADADASSATAAVVGIALHGALTSQPIVYQTGGALTINAVLTAGKVYVVSATAGAIAPAADLTTGWRTSVLGIAVSTTSLSMFIINSDVAN